MRIIQLLAEAASDLSLSAVLQIAGMTMIGIIGALVRTTLTNLTKSIDELKQRLDRNCRRLQRVENDTGRQAGRHVRRLKDDVDEDETDYE